MFLKITYIIFMLSCSWSFLFTCIEKALPPYRYATQAQKFPAYLRLSTNTLAQKSTCWPLPKFEEPRTIILCLTTFSRQIFAWIKVRKNCEIDPTQKLKLSIILSLNPLEENLKKNSKKRPLNHEMKSMWNLLI